MDTPVDTIRGTIAWQKKRVEDFHASAAQAREHAQESDKLAAEAERIAAEWQWILEKIA